MLDSFIGLGATRDGEEIFKIWGTGKPKREFMHVDDLANAIDYIIENKIEEPLINIGSSEEIAIKELAVLLKEIIGFGGDIKFDTTMPDGNPRKLLDSTMIRTFGWVPKIDLKSGLEQTYNWYLENIV